MTSETVTIEVPQTLYRRLERLAALTHRPLESLVTQTLLSSLPPLPDDLSPAIRDALVAIEPSSDDDLLQIVHSTFSEAQYEQLTALRERRRAGLLTPEEQITLERLSQEADLLALCKAYAAVLLKWRGHRLPSLADLES